MHRRKRLLGKTKPKIFKNKQATKLVCAYSAETNVTQNLTWEILLE